MISRIQAVWGVGPPHAELDICKICIQATERV